jgi:hypothetical protein
MPSRGCTDFIAVHGLVEHIRTTGVVCEAGRHSYFPFALSPNSAAQWFA